MAQKIWAAVTTPGGTYNGELWRASLSISRPILEVGLSPTPSEWDRWFAAVGPTVPRFCRVFSPLGSGLPAAPKLPAGCLPWISHKDPILISDLASWWAQWLPPRPDGRRYRWTFHHERAPGDQTARAAYLAYMADLTAAAAAFPHLEIVQIQSNYAMRWRPDTRWRDWLIPGVTLGFDCYPLRDYRYEPPESMFALLRHAADEIGAPAWGVPELGAEIRDRQDRAAWLLECRDYLADQGAAFLGLWCAHDTRRGADYRPTDIATLGAYQQMIGASA